MFVHYVHVPRGVEFRFNGMTAVKQNKSRADVMSDDGMVDKIYLNKRNVCEVDDAIADAYGLWTFEVAPRGNNVKRQLSELEKALEMNPDDPRANAILERRARAAAHIKNLHDRFTSPTCHPAEKKRLMAQWGLARQEHNLHTMQEEYELRMRHFGGTMPPRHMNDVPVT